MRTGTIATSIASVMTAAGMLTSNSNPFMNKLFGAVCGFLNGTGRNTAGAGL